MPSPGLDRAIRLASLIIALLATIAAVRWTRAQPFPLWWDEANYFNQVVDDRRAFLDGGAVALGKSLLFADNARPPAYRAVVAPVAAMTLPSLALLRAIALCVTMASLVLLGLACRTVASSSSSLLAAAAVFAMPEVLASGAWFGTEYPLFFAVALLLFSILRDVPAGVAAAVALGLLAKTSFLAIGGPLLLAALIAARSRRSLVLASACGMLIAASWWFWNFASALQFAEYGRTYQRGAYDHPLSLVVLGERLRQLSSAAGIGMVLAAVLLGINAFRRRDPVSPEARRALLLTVAAVVPIILMALLSPAFLPRVIAPALLALALPVAVLLDRARPALRIGVAALILAQVAWIATSPTSALPSVERTDWSRLRTIVRTPSPQIAFIGGWPSLSPPEICYGWTRDGQTASAEWLWRFEERRIDWPTVMHTALASDAVVVIPPEAAAQGSHHVRADSQHNAEFVRRLQASREFDQPVLFRIGTVERVDALVYQRRRPPT